MKGWKVGSIWINNSNGIGYLVETETTIIIYDTQQEAVVLRDLSDGSSVTISISRLEEDFTKNEKNIDTGIDYGLYKIHWWSGGTSLASIGYLSDGTKTISVTNWVNGHSDLSDVVNMVKKFEPILLNGQ